MLVRGAGLELGFDELRLEHVLAPLVRSHRTLSRVRHQAPFRARDGLKARAIAMRPVALGRLTNRQNRSWRNECVRAGPLFQPAAYTCHAANGVEVHEDERGMFNHALCTTDWRRDLGGNRNGRSRPLRGRFVRSFMISRMRAISPPRLTCLPADAFRQTSPSRACVARFGQVT